MSAPDEDPLYDVALEEIVEVIPPQLTENTLVMLKCVRELMVLSWLRGAAWSKEHEH